MRSILHELSHALYIPRTKPHGASRSAPSCSVVKRRAEAEAEIDQLIGSYKPSVA